MDGVLGIQTQEGMHRWIDWLGAFARKLFILLFFEKIFNE